MGIRLCIFVCAVLLILGFVLGFLLPELGELALWARKAPPAGSTTTPGSGSVPKVDSSWDVSLGAQPRFVDVTATAGIDFHHENGHTGRCRYLEIMGAGVGAFDYDSDGDLDLYFVNGNRFLEPPLPEITNRLYRNEGDMTFTDVTAKAGVGDAAFGQGCCVGDYDDDGDSDLYVSNYGVNLLYRNNGDGTFTDVAAAAGVADPGWGQTCSFLDYNRDGWLDLYVQNYLDFEVDQQADAFVYVGKEKVIDYPTPLGYPGQADRLFRNNGDGTFRDVTRETGMWRPDGKGMGAACVDLDDDGYVDIFVANDTAENFLFRGQADGTFREAGLTAGVAFDRSGVPEASMGVDVGDFDHDGRLDLIVPCLQRQFFTLYRNVGGFFEDVSVPSGLAQATAKATGFNANFFDYDNDGDLDIFFTAGGVRMNENAPADASYNERYGIADVLVANSGPGKFKDVSAFAGDHFRRQLIGRGCIAADLDNDGDQDLVLCNLADAAVVLRNDTAGGSWLVFDLRDRQGRRQPMGTEVWVHSGEVQQRAVVHGAVTYLSQGDRRPHFGLGDAIRADRVEIRWPDGERQELQGLEANRRWVIEQGKTPRDG